MKLGVALVVSAFAVAAATSAFADERVMFVNIGGTVGIGEPSDPGPWVAETDTEGVLIARVFASWEAPPLPYKEPKGYRWRGGISPEIMLGRLRIADHRTGNPEDNAANFIAAGARLEVAYSQRRMGLFKLSARGGFYAAARVGVLDDELRTPLIEGVVGEYLQLGDETRLGFEAGVMNLFIEDDHSDEVIRTNARGPWADGSGGYTAGVFTLYLGVKL